MALEAVRCGPGRARGGVGLLEPLLRPIRETPARRAADPEETPRGVALTALKEIEFDRETGKLSDEDYEFLKRKYTGAALEALRAESADAAGTVMPRP